METFILYQPKILKITIPLHAFILIIFLCSSVKCLLEIPIRIIDSKNSPKFGQIKFQNISSEILNNFNNYGNLMIKEKDITLSDSSVLVTDVEIGTPGQKFSLLLDTGSQILWVAGTDSKDKENINHHFNPQKSSTISQSIYPFDIKYGTGSCSGYYYNDNMTYFNKKFKMTFGLATKTDYKNNGEADGILGLSRYYDDENKSFISMLKNAGITDSKLFSFKLGEEAFNYGIGSFFIGKHSDFENKGAVRCELLDLEPSSKMFWACTMTKFIIENSFKKISASSKIPIIFDTGTNYIILPYSYLLSINDQLSAVGCKVIDALQSDLSKKTHALICHKQNYPEFQFVIGGTTFKIPDIYSYFLYSEDPNYVYSRILFQDDNTHYIMGAPFFLAFHTLFDDEKRLLHFYPEKSSYIVKDTWINPDNVIKILLLIFLIVTDSYISYQFYLLKRNKTKKYGVFVGSDVGSIQ